ncbi:heavy-metal-associated domain-containing protein [Mycolicibacterium sp.]|uniref:heavy-metal-associated domain-containing protein n=1 Tax=Mycolicibacterium sp. TaxID=2320850 RepID=UPI0037C826CF
MTVVVQVAGMTCGHCVSTIEHALSSVAGVKGASVDLATGTVTVDGDADLSAITTSIVDAGYAVQGTDHASQTPHLPLADPPGGCCCG